MFDKKRWAVLLSVLLLAGLVAGCSDDDDATPLTISEGGVFNTPVGDTDAGPLTAGNTYSFTFDATSGQKLGFATMYIQSNDLFFSPSGAGIDLFSGGTAVTGDVTSQVMLWDGGTEVNQEPGVGDEQAPRQSEPNTGTDEGGTVRLVSEVGDGFTYAAATDLMMVIISESSGTFTVTIELDSAATTPLAPGVFVVYTGSDPLFTNNVADRGEGLEALAEDGDPSTLATSLGL